MKKIVKYRRGEPLIFCNFCKFYFYGKYFYNHLSSCRNYLRYVIQKNRTPRLSYQDVFQRFLQKKRVILIGPSVTVQECFLGNFVESFDLVVRLNKSLPIPTIMQEHIGRRTDILYNSLNTTDYLNENNINPFFFRNQNVKYVRCPYPPVIPFKYDIQKFQKKSKNIIHFGHIDTYYYSKIKNNLKTRPYSGTCAIADILKQDIKELYVMGIDFYSYGYASYYRKVNKKKLERLRNNHIHKREPQIDLIKRFYLLDDRLVVDNVLDSLLLHQYDTLFHNIQAQISFQKTLISLKKKYIRPENVLHAFLRNNQGNEKDERNIHNKKRIGIFGSDPPAPNSKNKKFDLIISTTPFTQADVIIFTSIDEWLQNKKKNKINEHHTVIITQTFSKKIKIPKHIASDDVFLLNPLFSKYLRSILEKTVITEGSVSTEIFICLFFSVFFHRYAEILLYSIDPYRNWSKKNPNDIPQAISQRMLFKYLVRRNFTRMSPTP
jgi:hypothetical protein